MIAMAQHRIVMAEETQVQRIEVDSWGNRKLSVTRRAGAVERNLQRGESVEWRETESFEKAAAEVGLQGGKSAGFRLPPPLDPGLIMRQQRPLMEALATMALDQWTVVIRSFRQHRMVRGRSGSDHSIIHCHEGLHLRGRILPGDREIEVGEGRLPGEAFNRDGLLQRLRNVVENRRRARPFHDSLSLPLVLAAGDGGIIWHELMGHSLEGDHVLSGDSPLSVNDIGRRVMSKEVTLSARCETDPFLPRKLRDDEGETCRHHRLIEDGVLRRFICDGNTGKRLEVPERGHARQESFDRPVLPRMFALYLQPGKATFEDVLGSVRRGVYAAEFGLGRVLFRKGRFAFHIPSAFLIENGRLGPPLGPVMVQGDLETAFRAVTMVGDDFRLDRGISFCHKRGQVLHVRVGQPTVRVDGLTVSPGVEE